jgi:RNA polymerase sigma-70 factor (ECF subfamily)
MDARFLTTHWSVVLAAASHESDLASTALSKLCQRYWYPLYAHIRRRGYSPHDAQDLTQEFFAHLLESQAFAKADPTRGRFRSFVLTALNHFLIHEWNKARAQKRGGGRQFVSLDFASAEGRFDLEPTDEASPDKIFAKTWAVALLDEVLSQLEAEYQQAGRGELFAALRQTLTGAREAQPYAYLGERLGMNEGALKTAVHRLRKRYRELLHIEITHTVACPDDAAQELRDLFAALAG